MNRRTFVKTVAAGAGVLPLLAAKRRKLKIGYTCIAWGAFPRAPETLEPAMKDISSLGFYSFETFPEILDYWDEKDALHGMIEKYSLPLKSGYISTDFIDPSKKKRISRG